LDQLTENMPQNRGDPKFFYGWIIAGFASLVMVVCFGVQYSFGIFFKSLIGEFGWTRAAISGIFSLYMVTRAVFSVVMGYFSDQWGPRLTVAIGGMSMGLGLLLSGQVKALWQLYLLYGGMGGLGAACFYVPLASTLSKWFMKKRGLVLGIFTAGVGLGAVIFSPLIEFLISTYNWRSSYIVLGLITLVTVLTSALLIRQNPEAMGLRPNGETVSHELMPELNPRHDTEKGYSLGKAILTTPFWVLLVIEIMNYMSTITPMVHIVPYATDAGVSPMVSAGILAVIGGFSILGRLMVGGISDKWGAKNLLPLTFIGESVMLLFLILSNGATMFYIFAIIFGLAYGGSVPLIPVITASHFGLGSMGAIFGVISFGGILGGAFGPFMAGYIYDVTKQYSVAFLTVGILAAVAAVLSFYLRRLEPPKAFS
jgi:OFA family oxalate/formate antiporter-like MFS transporter